MKKAILITAVALMAMTSVKAQEYETKHEVGISYGWLSTSNWLDVFEDVIGAMTGVSFGDESFLGPISAEYFYHVKNWLGVGGIVAYGYMDQDLFLHKSGTADGKVENTYFTVMPAVKFDWLRKKNFGMYSKLGLGATLRDEKINYNTNQYSDYSDSEVHFNWQVSLLGIEVGSPKFRGFFEVGAGEQGTTLLGLRYKF